LTHYGAVHLFLDRVHLRLPDFDLTPENARAVAKICERLEGMPLAIELATARVGTLTVPQISERLGDSLALLAAGPRTAAPRQRTMRATLDWSYGLLSEPEQKVFRRLSVFAGGWALEASEAVGAGDGTENSAVMDLHGTLVDKSLVVAEVAEDGPMRYRMLEPVRQLAREKRQESGEAEVIRHRQAAYFLALAERAGPELRGPGQVEWLERLEADNGNLRAAMAWLLEADKVEDAVRLG
jgi:predicted ATPase